MGTYYFFLTAHLLFINTSVAKLFLALQYYFEWLISIRILLPQVTMSKYNWGNKCSHLLFRTIHSWEGSLGRLFASSSVCFDLDLSHAYENWYNFHLHVIKLHLKIGKTVSLLTSHFCQWGVHFPWVPRRFPLSFPDSDQIIEKANMVSGKQTW